MKITNLLQKLTFNNALKIMKRHSSFIFNYVLIIIFLFSILEKLSNNLLFLGENADKQSTTYAIVRDHRVILLKIINIYR